MMKILIIDFETRSHVVIGGSDGVGLYNYMTHPTTGVLMMGYRITTDKAILAGQTTERKIWLPHLGPMPQEVEDAFNDEQCSILAFNSAFERYVLQYCLRRTIQPKRFLDPQVGSRYLAGPPDLDTLCMVLQIPAHLAKDKRGEALIKLFCEPVIPRKKCNLPSEPPYYNDWNSHPKEWIEFQEYCMRDVEAEEEAYRRLVILQALPMTPFERELWIFDQTVNDRGMPVDIEFVDKLYALATREKEQSLEEQNAITGLENANSRDQLLPWARARGYTYNTLNKAFVETGLKDPDMRLSEECRIVLTKRLAAGSTSYTKLAAIRRNVCKDGMIRNMFIYLGSSRCGRWAGSAVQPHNFPRPLPPKDMKGHDFEDDDVITEARLYVYREDYQGIRDKYGSVLNLAKCLLRTVFIAPGSTQHD